MASTISSTVTPFGRRSVAPDGSGRFLAQLLSPKLAVRSPRQTPKTVDVGLQNAAMTHGIFTSRTMHADLAG